MHFLQIIILFNIRSYIKQLSSLLLNINPYNKLIMPILLQNRFNLLLPIILKNTVNLLLIKPIFLLLYTINILQFQIHQRQQLLLQTLKSSHKPTNLINRQLQNLPQLLIIRTSMYLLILKILPPSFTPNHRLLITIIIIFLYS